MNMAAFFIGVDGGLEDKNKLDLIFSKAIECK
jgi:hypothetical protein